MSRAAGIVVLSLIAAISLLAGLATGSVHISLGKLFSALMQPGGDAISDIVWKLRVPRVLAAFSCGALLAMAGALMQVLLRNPLADPYVFGISGGAALGVMLGMLLGVGALMQTGMGLAGAVLASALVFGLSLRAGNWNPYRLLLTGVVVAAGLNALLSLILVLTPQGIIRDLKLRRPIYRRTAAYGHFGRNEAGFTWEELDKVNALKG